MPEKEAKLKLVRRVCPLCGRDNRASSPNAYSKAPWTLKECVECSFVYLEDAPDYIHLNRDLAWENLWFERETKQRTNQFSFVERVRDGLKDIKRKAFKRDKLSSLVDGFFERGKVLDVGCAAGDNLIKLNEKYIPFGIEISSFLADYSQKLLAHRDGLILHADALSGLRTFPDKNFSGVILSSFLEHEIYPGELLRECGRALSDNGRVVIKVPNFGSLNRALRGKRWCGFRFPDHVNYFTPGTLRSMCAAANLCPIRFAMRDRHPLSDSLWMVATSARCRGVSG